MIQIVPQISSASCGVTDYSMLIGNRIREFDRDIRSACIACGHLDQRQAVDSKSEIRDLRGQYDARRLWMAIRELIEQTVDYTPGEVGIALQYSGYGYERNGAPHWLAEVLEDRPAWFSSGRIVSVFHELYATGWPWQKAYWHSSRQQAVSARIARASDGLMTNREMSARWLEQVAGRTVGGVSSLPVPSNVGEPSDIPPWSLRPPHAVCFGGARFKKRFLTGRAAAATADLCCKLDINTIHVVGQRSEFAEQIFRARKIDINQTGILAADEVSQYFVNARLAFVDYFPDYYAKSSVLAAAAAHGTPAIFTHSLGASDGLQFGTNLWSLTTALSMGRNEVEARLSDLSQSIHAWYQAHDSGRHAQAVSDLFRRDSV